MSSGRAKSALLAVQHVDCPRQASWLHERGGGMLIGVLGLGHHNRERVQIDA